MPQIEENENMGLLERQIEALLFVSPQPVSSVTMADHLGVSPERVDRAVAAIKSLYAKGRGLTLLNLAGGWQMATAPDLADTVESFSAYLSMQRIRPVSYTHLDVYKRQEYGSCPYRLRRGARQWCKRVCGKGKTAELHQGYRQKQGGIYPFCGIYGSTGSVAPVSGRGKLEEAEQ